MLARASVLSAIGCALLVIGCGGTTPIETIDERFEAPEAHEARTRAPDMYAAAERAREDARAAEDADDPEAAADHATRARLLLETAIAESDRLALEERRIALEEATRVAEERRARDVEARLAIERTLARTEAARVAREQAAIAYANAEGDDPRRFRSREERDALHRESAALLRSRASLMIAAAEALGAAEGDLADARRTLEESGRTRDPAASVRSAELAMRAALRALGAARARLEPTSDERASLLEAAETAGLEVMLVDRGLALRLDGVFAGTSAAPSANGRRKLESIAALVAAHPASPVQVVAYSGAGAAPQRERAAAARAEAVRRILADAGVPSERLQAQGSASTNAASANAIDLVFTAFGPSVASAQAPPAP
jgi:flagellar motor protein MotB